MEQVLSMFAYLKGHSNSEMVFDPSKVEFDRADFPRQDWSYSIYTADECEIKEELPPIMPKPRGNGMIIMVYVDIDHAGDTVTRKSRTGFVIFLNSAPICWSSKKKTSPEKISFGGEFCAMKQAIEYVRGLHYKLRMMGILVDEPTFVDGDNQSLLANTTMPVSTLNKKTKNIAFHHVREGTARDK